MSLTMVNARERKPVKFGMYWAKVDGRRMCLRFHEFDEYLEKYDEVLWVEEPTDIFIPAPIKQGYVFKKDDDEVKESINPIVKNTTKASLSKEEIISVQTILESGVVTNENIVNSNETINTLQLERALQTTCKKSKKRNATNYLERKYYPRSYNPLVDSYGYESTFGIEHCPIDRSDFRFDLKNSTRNTIIDMIKKFNCYPLGSSLINLCNVRILFPLIKGQKEIPTELLTQMEWVYGRKGVHCINRRLFNTFKSNKSQNKNNKK